MGFMLWDLIRFTWQNWCSGSNVGGAGNIHRSRSNCAKIIWLIIFIGGLVGTLVTLVQVILAYQEYEVSTSVTLAKNTNLKFPAVTICNQNRVDCGKLYAMAKACEGIENTSSNNDPKYGDDSESAKCEFIAEGKANVSVVVKLVKDLRDYACMWKDNKTEMDQVNEDEFTKMYMFLGQKNRRIIGQKFNRLVQACTFKQGNCHDQKYFWATSDPSYGNCFTFNTALNDMDPKGGTRVSSLTGPEYGLSLVLNVEQDKYMVNKLTKQAGARVAVHSEYNLPLMVEYGHDLMPSTATALSVQEVQISRQAAPYTSNCITRWEQTNYTEYSPTMGNYTLPLCQRVCLLSLFNTECGCIHPSFIGDDSNRLNHACEVGVEDTDYPCMSTIYEQLDNGNLKCNCSVQCDETDYIVTSSLSLFPSSKYEAEAKADYGFSVDSGIRMSDNLLKVNVYFATLNVQTITETPVYSSVWSSKFISALGGALSLYLGISIAMIFELVEFFWCLAANLYLYIFKGRQPWKVGKKKGKCSAKNK